MNPARRISLLVALVSTVAAPALADLARTDKYFLEQAAKSGMKQVDVSQHAMAHLTAPDVRNFAQQIANDYVRAITELQALAGKKGVALPPPDGRIARRWTENRKEFDDEYLAEITNDHRAAIELFEKAARSTDAEIAEFALKTLPDLRTHLESVQQLRKSVVDARF